MPDPLTAQKYAMSPLRRPLLSPVKNPRHASLCTVELRLSCLCQLRLRSRGWATLDPVTCHLLFTLGDVVKVGSVDGLAGMLLGLSRRAALDRSALAGEILLSCVDLGDDSAVEGSGVRLRCVLALQIR